jgi:CII-binding regulator of phage lambda lysogenization HflD
MRPIIIMIAALVFGISVISIGFLLNEEVETVENTLTPYEKLEKYKEDLEKINQYNLKILSELEKKIIESDDVHLEQIKKEIEVLKRVINDNKAELEQVIKKLSEIKDEQ